MSTEGGLQRQFYEMLMESQWWSADELRAYQRNQLPKCCGMPKRTFRSTKRVLTQC